MKKEKQNYESNQYVTHKQLDEKLSHFPTHEQLTKALSHFVTNEQLTKALSNFITKKEFNIRFDRLEKLILNIKQ